MEIIDRWMFGDQPDKLAEKVLKGTKTATCGLYDGWVPPEAEKNIIMNSKGEDVCMIETYAYRIMKYCEMTDKLARAEGEKNLKEWQDIHKRFFSSELGISEEDFDENTLILYYEFRLIEKYI